MMLVLKLFLIKRWPVGCLLIFIMSCSNAPETNQFALTRADSLKEDVRKAAARRMVASSKSLISQGDIILRTGNDFTSEQLRRFSQTDKTFSHCGIASIEHDSVFVYHALGGEWNPDQKLRRDPLESFCNADDNRGFGIFRFDLAKIQRLNLDSVVHSWFNKGLMFDMEFRLETDDRLYCAEFVCKAIMTATANDITFNTTSINDFNFYAVDNLMLNKHCLEKKRYRFE